MRKWDRPLQTKFASLNAREERRIQRSVYAALLLPDVKRIRSAPVTVAGAHEFLLFRPKCCCHLKLAQNAQKNRPRIFGQPLAEVRPELPNLKLLPANNRGHSGTP